MGPVRAEWGRVGLSGVGEGLGHALEITLGLGRGYKDRPSGGAG